MRTGSLIACIVLLGGCGTPSPARPSVQGAPPVGCKTDLECWGEARELVARAKADGAWRAWEKAYTALDGLCRRGMPDACDLYAELRRDAGDLSVITDRAVRCQRDGRDCARTVRELTMAFGLTTAGRALALHGCNQGDGESCRELALHACEAPLPDEIDALGRACRVLGGNEAPGSCPATTSPQLRDAARRRKDLACLVSGRAKGAIAQTKRSDDWNKRQALERELTAISEPVVRGIDVRGSYTMERTKTECRNRVGVVVRCDSDAAITKVKLDTFVQEVTILNKTSGDIECAGDVQNGESDGRFKGAKISTKKRATFKRRLIDQNVFDASTAVFRGADNHVPRPRVLCRGSVGAHTVQVGIELDGGEREDRTVVVDDMCIVWKMHFGSEKCIATNDRGVVTWGGR